MVQQSPNWYSKGHYRQCTVSINHVDRLQEISQLVKLPIPGMAWAMSLSFDQEGDIVASLYGTAGPGVLVSSACLDI